MQLNSEGLFTVSGGGLNMALSTYLFNVMEVQAETQKASCNIADDVSLFLGPLCGSCCMRNGLEGSVWPNPWTLIWKQSLSHTVTQPTVLHFAPSAWEPPSGSDSSHYIVLGVQVPFSEGSSPTPHHTSAKAGNLPCHCTVWLKLYSTEHYWKWSWVFSLSLSLFFFFLLFIAAFVAYISSKARG